MDIAPTEDLAAENDALRREVDDLRRLLHPSSGRDTPSRRGLLKGLGAAGAVGALATAGTTVALAGRSAPADALSPSRNAPGSICYVAIESSRGRVAGDVTRNGQLWIGGFALELGASNPTDATTGRATNRIQWLSVQFRQPTGRATPLLTQLLALGEIIQVTIEVPAGGPSERETVGLRYRLRDAVVTTLRTQLAEPVEGSPASRFGFYDEVAMNYAGITIEHVPTGTAYQTATRPR